MEVKGPRSALFCQGGGGRHRRRRFYSLKGSREMGWGNAGGDDDDGDCKRELGPAQHSEAGTVIDVFDCEARLAMNGGQGEREGWQGKRRRGLTVEVNGAKVGTFLSGAVAVGTEVVDSFIL